MNTTPDPTIILNSFDKLKFGDSDSEKPYDNFEYVPLFGIGDIVETKIYCMTARPLKISVQALKYYGLTDKTPVQSLVSKQVGVIRRIIRNNEKTDEYHCQICTLVNIFFDNNYGMSYGQIEYKNDKNETLTEDINIHRLCIPKLIDTKTY